MLSLKIAWDRDPFFKKDFLGSVSFTLDDLKKYSKEPVVSSVEITTQIWVVSMLITARKRSCEKVMFSQVSISPRGGGGAGLCHREPPGQGPPTVHHCNGR